jgi:hypothetical protein
LLTFIIEVISSALASLQQELGKMQLGGKETELIGG